METNLDRYQLQAIECHEASIPLAWFDLPVEESSKTKIQDPVSVAPHSRESRYIN
jgi:hypothetical protein